MLYQICNGAVRFAADTILENINFEIRNTEKIAIVGRNGSGKTTLLKLIAGEVELSKRDSDEDIYISRAGKPTIGYLKQISFEDETTLLDTEVRKVFAPILAMQTRMEEMVLLMESNKSEKLIQQYADLQEHFEDIGGYYYEKDYDIMLKKFGFTPDDKQKPLSEFSGGQKTKIAFIKLLLSKPDILLLDEPTNHLDIDTIEWLEAYLQDYNRAVVIVSHDRVFLDRIVSVVYEIEYRTAKRYAGNYSRFMEQKRQNYDKQMKDYLLQKKEIDRLTNLAEKFKHHPTKVSMAHSKMKSIEHMEKIEAPDRFDTKTFHAAFEPIKEPGKDILTVKKLEIGYDRVLSCVSLELKKGQRLGIIGSNGIGKSTLLKTLIGQTEGLGGEFRFGRDVEIGYFDQLLAQFSSDKSVLDEFWDEFPTLTQTEARNALGAFLFSGDDVFKKVSMLSGGERVRLALCRILKRRPNVLILDEPTNHMDIIGKETLESMLKDYSGTIIFVSHDRYFIKQVSTVLLVMEESGNQFFSYGYDDYMEKKSATMLTEYKEELNKRNGVSNNVSKKDRLLSEFHKAAQANMLVAAKPAKSESDAYYNPGKELSKVEKKIEKTEAAMTECELLIQSKKDELLNPDIASDYVLLSDIQKEIDEKEQELLELMAGWDELTSLQADIQQEINDRAKS